MLLLLLLCTCIRQYIPPWTRFYAISAKDGGSLVVPNPSNVLAFYPTHALRVMIMRQRIIILQWLDVMKYHGVTGK